MSAEHAHSAEAYAMSAAQAAQTDDAASAPQKKDGAPTTSRAALPEADVASEEVDAAAALAALSPMLQHALVHLLHWRSLRPIQAKCVAPLLAGENAVVIAPTAGGKTEAALLPLLSRWLTAEPREVAERAARAERREEGRRETQTHRTFGATLDEKQLPGPLILYVAPTRALLNQLVGRVNVLAGYAGGRAGVWHGDIPSGERGALLRQGVEVWCTTPESVEALLLTRTLDQRVVFSRLRAIVIDETHALAGSERGAHLSSLMERLAMLAGRDLQRVGLSATVGDPETMLRWLQGGSHRPGRVLRPAREPRTRALRVATFGSDDEMFAALSSSTQGHRSLIFCNARGRAEDLLASLTRLGGQPVLIHHGALSRTHREAVESRLQAGECVTVVCTSTLELGLDLGELDRVFQLDAPPSVGSLLQRLGRTGRRGKKLPTFIVVTRREEAAHQAWAMLDLALGGWVEPVEPETAALEVLSQQLLAQAFSPLPLTRQTITTLTSRAQAFSNLKPEAITDCLADLLNTAQLEDLDGQLLPGPAAERRYAGKNLANLCAVFGGGPSWNAQSPEGPLASLDRHTALSLEPGNLVRLAGRIWRVSRRDDPTENLHLTPADPGASVKNATGTSARTPPPVHPRVLERMRELEEVERPEWVR